jgi:hypothetical protein
MKDVIRSLQGKDEVVKYLVLRSRRPKDISKRGDTRPAVGERGECRIDSASEHG